MWRDRPFRIDRNSNGDRGRANPDGFGVETDQVADKDRGYELYFANRDGHKLPVGMLVRLDNAGLVDVTQDDPAEDRPEGVDIARHHPDANGRL